ncbi:hypothetical protein PV327_008453 [Microctonus hyperodae]|uniref:Uncharacterized protein n=1 Tax=Microctonus hyperodae TaxID=165561 RepID=A0AA39F376_MICHY|nr:hypothetical protein PV327_008453 [Microctonus hyperodae]
MLVLRNLHNINTLLVLGTLMLCVVFMIQLKDIYSKNRRYYRYLGYRQYITEISMGMDAAEQTANKSATYIHQISEALLKHEKEMKNNTSKVVFPSR